MPTPTTSRLVLLAAVVAGIFVVDLLLPLGIAGGVPYAAAVLLALWLPGERYARAPLVVAAVGTALTAVGLALSAPGGPKWAVLSNRFLAVSVIWTVAVLAMQRRRTEAALVESEARTRLILEATADGIVTVDAGGVVSSANPAAGRIFGEAPGALTGRRFGDLLAAPYREPFERAPGAFLERHAPRAGEAVHEVQGRRADGTTFPMELTAGRLSPGGQVSYTCTLRDISRRRHLEQEVLRAVEQERRAIGHDLHEELGQSLTGLGLISRQLARQMQAAGSAGADEMAEIAERIRETDRFARKLFEGLVPVEPEKEGLGEALRRLAATVEATYGLACRVERADPVSLPDSTVATHLYRIAQDTVRQIVQAGPGCGLTLALEDGPEGVRVRVGTDCDAPFREGTATLNLRTHFIGAFLEVTHPAGGGTVVSCTLPK